MNAAGKDVSVKAFKMLLAGGALSAFCALAALLASQTAYADGTWRSARPMETARSDAAAAVLNNEIFIAGGASVIGPRDVFEAFDTDAEFWRPLPALPEARESFAMAALAGELYIAGGYEKDPTKPTSDLWIYDPEKSEWREGASLPGGRAEHTLLALQNKLYLLGGKGPQAETVHIYEPGADQWTKAPWRLPTTRIDVAAVASEDKYIYILGGQDQNGPTKRFERVDVTTGKIKRLADMPFARSGHTAAVLKEHIHVTGGVSGAALKTYSEHDVYDLKGNTWSKEDPLPTPRRGLVSAVVNGRWYVIGGGAGAGFFTVFTEADAVEIFTPSGL